MNPYLKKYKGGGKGDPEDPIKDILNIGLKLPKNEPMPGLGGQPYQQTPTYSYNWSNPKASTPTAVHIPSGTYATAAEIEKRKKAELVAIARNAEEKQKIKEKEIVPGIQQKNVTIDNTYTGVNPYMTSFGNATERTLDEELKRKKLFESYSKNTLQALNDVVGNVGSGLLYSTGEAFTAPAAAAIEGFNYISGKPYNFQDAVPNATRIALNASGQREDLNNYRYSDGSQMGQQKTMTELLGIDRKENPTGALIADVFTPTLPFSTIGKAFTGANKIKYAPKINALDRTIDKIPGMINKVPNVNTNVAASIADNVIAPPRTINTLQDIEQFRNNAAISVGNLTADTRDLLLDYSDHLLRQAAPENVDIYDYMEFVEQNLNNPQILDAFADKMENMKRTFPFLDPSRNVPASEISASLDNARRIMSGYPTSQWGLNTNNQYVQMMNEWADQQRRIIRRMPSGNTLNIGNIGQAYNPNVGSQIQTLQLPSIQNSGIVRSFNVQDFVQALRPKSFVEKAKKTIEDINYKLGKKFFPVKSFDEKSFVDEINAQLQKGMGIKKDDYKINVTKNYTGYDVHVLFPGETQPRHIGGINLRKSKNAEQKTFTEGLLGNKNKNMSFEKPNDFPYQNEPKLIRENTGIGAEVHKAMSDALKKQDAGLTSSMFHLDPGNIRYIHEAINKRGAIPLEGFTQKHFDELDDLRKKIGIGGKKIDTENYINSLDLKEKERILSLFRHVRWKIPKVAGIATTGAAATYGADQLIKEMEDKKESYKYGGSVKTYTKWVNDNSK